MEENVALDSKKQKKFVKSIRGIKKLIKKNEGKPVPQKKDEKVEPQKPFSMRLNNGKIKKRKRMERGLVYLSHIPHGFYEHQMTQYFKQFGVVTNARVIKSKRTGNSKGFAFVEFKEPAVGQIVAETMNNYLMGKRLIKAAYIPPEKQKLKAFRKHWNSVNNPSSQARLKLKKAFNTDKDEAGDLKKARKLLSNLSKTKKKLSELGISYDFFTPVDVPEALQNQLIKQEKDVNSDVKEETSQVKKNVKKGKPSQTDDKANGKNKVKPTQVVNVKASKANNNKLVVVNAKEQKEKNLTLKKAGVKPADEFIKIEDDDSDSSYAFDSDEYEKMLQDEINYDLSADESDSDDDDEDDDSEDPNESKEESPGKAIKELALKIVSSVQTRKQAQKQEPPKLQVMQQKKQKQKPQAKMNGYQNPAVTSKKPKFEKQNQKQIKKSFKMK